MERNKASRKRKAVRISDERLYKELHREINTGFDDATAIRARLKRRRFETFSEDRKLEYLAGERHGYQTSLIASVSLLNEVLKKDAIGTFRLLLPMIPTYQLARRRIPEEYQWIGYMPVVQRFLHTSKSRWTPGKCRCKSHVEPSTTAERHCAITKLASNALAAELFELAAKYAYSRFVRICNANTSISDRCMLYLLAVCPELLSTSVQTETLALALVASPELREMCLEPRVLKYLHHSIEDLVVYFLKARQTRSLLEYVKVFVGVAGRLFTDKLLRYRSNGSTFLHIACENKIPFYDADVYFVKLLLRLGIDPAETNDEGLTALDVLLRDFYLSGDLSTTFRSFNENPNWARTKRVLESQLVTVRTMLPYFKDKAIANLTLPTLSPGVYDPRTFMLDMIKVWEVFWDVNLFPQFTLKHMNLVVEHGLAGSSSPCVTCEPLARLVHREMCKGMPVYSRYIWNLLDEIMRHIYYHLEDPHPGDRYRNYHGTVSPICCLWKTAELIIHSAAGLDEDTAETLVGALGFRERTGTVKVPLNVVRRVVRMLWMYAPSSEPHVVAFLQRLATATDSEARDTAAELLGMVEGRPKSLQMLARNSLVRAVEYKDIPRLPLPPRMVRYVQIGEISDEHPVEQN